MASKHIAVLKVYVDSLEPKHKASRRQPFRSVFLVPRATARGAQNRNGIVPSFIKLGTIPLGDFYTFATDFAAPQDGLGRTI